MHAAEVSGTGNLRLSKYPRVASIGGSFSAWRHCSSAPGVALAPRQKGVKELHAAPRNVFDCLAFQGASTPARGRYVSWCLRLQRKGPKLITRTVGPSNRRQTPICSSALETYRHPLHPDLGSGAVWLQGTQDAVMLAEDICGLKRGSYDGEQTENSLVMAYYVVFSRPLYVFTPCPASPPKHSYIERLIGGPRFVLPPFIGSCRTSSPIRTWPACPSSPSSWLWPWPSPLPMPSGS